MKHFSIFLVYLLDISDSERCQELPIILSYIVLTIL